MKLRKLSAICAGACITTAGFGMASARAQAARTTICHVPEGNVGNGQTLSLPPGAADAHLRNHSFDHLGPCTGIEPTPPAGSLTDLSASEAAGVGADASGGDGGSARGGDGGRGGSGTLPTCNQNSNDVTWDEWWEDGELVSDEPSVDCGAGARGGEGGDAGISEGGDGGVAFDIGGTPAATPVVPVFSTVGFA